MLIYDYNSALHKYKDVHDEAGGRLKDFSFQYDDCFCGAAEYRIVSTTTRHHNHFDVVQCTKCGTLRINPYLSDASIATYYQEVYGPVKRKDMTAESLFARQAQTAGDMFTLVSPWAQRDAMILDYGAGAGGRMEKLRAEGYSNVHIFDYDAQYMAHGVSRGMKPHKEGNRYDMITLSHVIEHVNNPLAALIQFKKDMLAPDGKIIIEVPLLGVRERMIGDFHLAHKYYFTAASLAILAALAGCKILLQEDNAIIVTPVERMADVSPEQYRAALAESNALLAKAKSEARMVAIKMALKRLLEQGEAVV